MYSSYKLSIFQGHRKDLEEEINEWIDSSFLQINDLGIKINKLVYCFDWSDEDHDMNKLSRAFPDVVFLLQVEGESLSCAYKMFVKNGKHHTVYAKIVYDDYNETELLDLI